MHEATVINMLLRWQRRKLKVVDPLGYPKQSPFTKLTPSGSVLHDPEVDTEFMLTDKAVGLLPEVYKLVIRLEYIDAIPSMEQKAIVYGKSRRDYGRDRSRAYFLLGNLLDALIEVEHKMREIA